MGQLLPTTICYSDVRLIILVLMELLIYKPSKGCVRLTILLGILIGAININDPLFALSGISVMNEGCSSERPSVRPSSSGTQAIQKCGLSIDADNPTGHSLYISMVDEDNALISEEGFSIVSTSGSVGTPAPLDIESWGFAVPSQSSYVAESNFDADYDAIGINGGLWAGVPKKDDMALIQKTEVNGTYDLDIYFGFKIGLKTAVGTYSGKVLFTALANPYDFMFDDFLVTPDSTDNLSGGNTVTITASVTPIVDWEDIGAVTVSIGEGDCNNASGAIESGTLTIKCEAPVLPYGTYDVKMSLDGLDGSTHTIHEGYVVELRRDSDRISVSPSAIKVDAAEELTISTAITTPDLTSDDFVVSIGDFACQVDSAVYNENGYWDISCITSEIHEPQIVDLALTIAKYGHKFHQEIVVGDVSLTEIAYIQQMTPTICSNTTTPSPEARETVRTHYSGQDKVPTNTLIDLRDGRSYTVSKLADGNCWMTQNLRIGGDEEITLTSEDSDVEAAFVLPIAQTSGKSGWNNAVPHIYDTGNDETGSIYNWYTATAGTGIDGEMADDSEWSICPKGWTLPSMNSNPGFLAMLNAYGWENSSQARAMLTAEPFWFVFSGGYYYGYGGTANGEYWSATPNAANPSNSYYLKLESLSGRVYTSSNKPRSGGAAIRCVAKTRN